MRIKDLRPEDEAVISEVSRLLVDAFKEHWPNAYPTLEDALEEVRESFGEGRVSRVAIDDDGTVLGWIGGQHSYARVWELHPLVVRGDRRREGIGRALVLDLEERVREHGASTLMLGTDDEDDMTTLSDVNLYEDTWQHVRSIQNLKGHPYEFYQKLGYAIIGVVPDANGLGKPDILMAKRVGRGRPRTADGRSR